MKSVRVLIPSALLSYTGAPEVELTGETVGRLLLDLDRRFPGIRFRIVDEQDRIRPHMRVYVNQEIAALDTPVSPADAVAIIMALSGG